MLRPERTSDTSSSFSAPGEHTLVAARTQATLPEGLGESLRSRRRVGDVMEQAGDGCIVAPAGVERGDPARRGVEQPPQPPLRRRLRRAGCADLPQIGDDAVEVAPRL